ncbi:hypothetical protein VPH35_102055 [Triticum aestivum]
MDEFTHMVKLELLDLSGNKTIGLKALILDGCVQLENVGPNGLPPSIESFSLTATSSQKAKVSKICLVGCVHLVNFTLRGAFPCLGELSVTLIRKLDFSHEVVHVPRLERLFLRGCKNLRAIRWRNFKRRLKVLRIRPQDSSFICSLNRKYDGEVYVRDARFIPSLVLGSWEFDSKLLITDSLYLNLDGSPEIKDEATSLNNVGTGTCNRQVVWTVRSPIGCCYHDVILEGVTDTCEVPQLIPLHRHIDIGDGINLNDVESNWGVAAIAPKPDSTVFGGGDSWFRLTWCRIDKCPKMQVVFASCANKWSYSFPHLETIWVTDLPMVSWEESVFGELRSIHLHNCPRLKFVLPISSFILPSLETIQIVHCCNLRQIFPWDVNCEAGKEDTVKNFPKLKHIYLHQLDCLEKICVAKMFAPKLETIRIRGSWGLRRLPAVSLRHGAGLPVVDCEKDLWDRLEWDGLEAGHHPSLFETHHSLYYKKALPRVLVLR